MPTLPLPPKKPKFVFQPCPYQSCPAPASSTAFGVDDSETDRWIDVLEFDADFDLRTFEAVLLQIILHPERNSSSILRADIITDEILDSVGRQGNGPVDPGETIEEIHDRTQNISLTEPLTQQLPDRRESAGPVQLLLDEEYETKRNTSEWTPRRLITCKILPNRPGRDAPLIQYCQFSRHSRPLFSTPSVTNLDSDSGEIPQLSRVVMEPDVKNKEEMPYYHPEVRKLAFTYEPLASSPEIASVPSSSSSAIPTKPRTSSPLRSEVSVGEAEKSTLVDSTVLSSDAGQTPPLQTRGRVRISLVLFDQADLNIPPDTAFTSSEAEEDIDTGPPDSFGSQDTTIPSQHPRSAGLMAEQVLPNRLYRTCMHLGETIHKYGWGMNTGYQKRVNHDIVIDRATFQDLYLIMKERHKHLDSRKDRPGFNKLEDKKRHVWKDVAVATFLMLLWKDMYPRRDGASSQDNEGPRQWDTWGRPEGGFLDIGCGNGLLVHILITEGYTGIGLELRARRTWPTYPERTQAALRENGINPIEWFPETLEDWTNGRTNENCPIREGMFLIGNHADEMTPWIPLFSLIPSRPVPFISLPCCAHTLSGMFTRPIYVPPFDHAALPRTLESLSGGLEKGESRYKAYLMWLGFVGLECGWKWEREVLRLPSTRNWAIIGRERWTKTPDQDEACRRWAFGQIAEIRRSGEFVMREKEGAVTH